MKSKRIHRALRGKTWGCKVLTLLWKIFHRSWKLENYLELSEYKILLMISAVFIFPPLPSSDKAKTLKQYVYFTQKVLHIYRDERIDLQVFHFKQHFLDAFQWEKVSNFHRKKLFGANTEKQKHWFQKYQQERTEKPVKFIIAKI